MKKKHIKRKNIKKRKIIFVSTLIILILINIILLLILINNYQQNKNKYFTIKKTLIENKIFQKNKPNLTEIKKEHINIKEEIKTKYGTTKQEEITTLIEANKQANNALTQTIANNDIEITNLENKKKELENQYNVLKKKRDEEIAIAQANKYQIPNVPTFNQYPKYPTGCESVALYILLRYYQVSVNVDDIINKLPKDSVPYIENNIKYGGNPELEFIGSPYTSHSYGVYEKPILNIASQYKSNIKNGTGKSLNEVLEIVKTGKPVLAWTSINLALPYISNQWTYKPTNELIKWKAHEHAVVIIGFTNNTIIISDPISGTIKSQNRQTFENRYNYYGRKNIYY